MSEASVGDDPFDRVRAVQVALVAVFVTALVTAQPTASKLLAFDLPISLPVTGSEIVLPGAALAYAVTFLASDCYAELYGRRAAQVMVNVAFGMNFLFLALLWSTIAAPAAIPPQAEQFEAVLAPATNIVLGSLLAYVVSQNWDVIAFHAIRKRTGEERLWLRNIGSTATSQAIDTVIFVSVAFYLAPHLLGVGDPSSLSLVASLIVGQYLFKLLVAVLDTPFVYAIVGYVRADGVGRAD